MFRLVPLRLCNLFKQDLIAFICCVHPSHCYDNVITSRKFANDLFGAGLRAQTCLESFLETIDDVIFTSNGISVVILVLSKLLSSFSSDRRSCKSTEFKLTQYLIQRIDAHPPLIDPLMALKSCIRIIFMLIQIFFTVTNDPPCSFYPSVSWSAIIE